MLRHLNYFHSYKMCLIRLRPDREEEVVIPNRPIVTETTLLPSRAIHSSHPPPSATTTAHPLLHQRPEVRARNSTNQVAPVGQEQAVVIEQNPPRSSTAGIQQIHQGSSHSYGEGLVPASSNRPSSRPLQGRSYSRSSQQGGGTMPPRRSRSLACGKSGSPRQSNASFRTTRERIVVVDVTGRKREYYRRDVSGR